MKVFLFLALCFFFCPLGAMAWGEDTGKGTVNSH